MTIINTLSLFHSSVASIKALNGFIGEKHLPVLCHKDKFNKTQNAETFLTTKRQETKSMKHSPVKTPDYQVVKDYVMENRIFSGMLGLFVV